MKKVADEVSHTISNSNHDNRKRETRSLHNGILCLLNICDLHETIRGEGVREGRER